MIRIALFGLAAFSLLGADNPWLKVEQLKSRQELKIYKKGTAEPVNAVFDEANDDRVIVVVKNKQIAIPKEDIDRIDARPSGKGGRTVTRQTTSKTVEPDYAPHPPAGADVPTTSYGSSVNFGSGKPDFQTVYRRPAPGRN